MKNDTHKKIDDVLNSLDEIQRAEASPYIFGRVRNRLVSDREIVPAKLAWRLVTILVIVAALNLFTMRYFGGKENTDVTGVELVANEYSISLPETY